MLIKLNIFKPYHPRPRFDRRVLEYFCFLFEVDGYVREATLFLLLLVRSIVPALKLCLLIISYTYWVARRQVFSLLILLSVIMVILAVTASEPAWELRKSSQNRARKYKALPNVFTCCAWNIKRCLNFVETSQKIGEFQFFHIPHSLQTKSIPQH